MLASKSSGTVNRINVVFVYAKDLGRLRYFYEQVFGLSKPVIDAKWWVEYEVGNGSHLALHQADAMRFEEVSRRNGTVKFSFDVSGMYHFIDKIKELGGKVHYEPRLEYGFYLSEFEDPEGNVLRLYEKVKK